MNQEELMKELLEPGSDLLQNVIFNQNSAMMTPKVAKVVLDPQGCLTLTKILQSFTAGINEEQAWALCYQCIKSAQAVRNNPNEKQDMLLITETDHVYLHQDGTVHKKSFLDHDLTSKGPPRTKCSYECKIISKLVHVVYDALEYGMEEDAERDLSPDLNEFLEKMCDADESAERPETDDEGIERDSGDSDDDRMGARAFNFDAVLKICRERLGSSSGTSVAINGSADNHYRAVCRALVAETLELSTFLQRVSQGTQQLRSTTISGHTHSGNGRDSSCPNVLSTEPALDGLHFSVWARLWVQVIRDLRNGVKLKKVESFEKSGPIEYELTPYEILMDDIRSQQYKLKQVMVDGELPPKVKRDAHDLILEFIRCRPPLKKAEERVLRPPSKKELAPIEALMESIRQKESIRLRPTVTRVRSSIRKDSVRNSRQTRRQSSYEMTTDSQSGKSNRSSSSRTHKTTTADADGQSISSGSSTRSASLTSTPLPENPPQRRLIKADLDALYALDKDDESDDGFSAKENGSCYYGHICPEHSQSEPVSPWKSKPEMGNGESNGDGGRGVDLRRRHTICVPSMAEERGALMITFPLEYTNNTLNVYNSLNGPSVSPILHRRKTKLPHSMSKSALQEEFFQSNQWQTAMECLSLNLEEVVHIRNVLTKAELEALPVDCSTKEDVEKGKVCFLCLKARFSLFGPWGNSCKLCKRMVCAKCCSKMRIPTEHFAKIPVSTLSPLLSPREDERDFMGSKSSTPAKTPSPIHCQKGRKNSVGSAPTSPSLSRKSVDTDSERGQRSISPGLLESEERDRFSPESNSGPYSLPTVSSISLGIMALKRRSFGRGRKEEEKTEKLMGALMVVCHDCKAMVLQIIRSSRAKKGQLLRNNMTLDLPSILT